MASEIWSGSSLKGRLSPSSDIFCCFAMGTGEHPRNQQQYVKLHQNQGAGWVWDCFHGTRHGFALCLELEGQIKVGRSGQYRWGGQIWRDERWWKHCWSVKCSAGPWCDCKDPKMPQPVPLRSRTFRSRTRSWRAKQWSQPSGLRRKMQWWRTEFCIAGNWMNLTLQMCLWQGAITNLLTRLASLHTNYNLEFRITSNFHLFCVGKVHVFHPHPIA